MTINRLTYIYIPHLGSSGSDQGIKARPLFHKVW